LCRGNDEKWKSKKEIMRPGSVVISYGGRKLGYLWATYYVANFFLDKKKAMEIKWRMVIPFTR
jgi:hypothetical protein